MAAPDKAFLMLGGQPLVAHALDAFERTPEVDSIVLVAGEHTLSQANALVQSGRWRKVDAVVTGGEYRQDSVAAGVAAASPGSEWIAIHDGARPLVQTRLIQRCIERAWETGAAIAAVPVADSLKRVSDGVIRSSLPREGVWAAQTPQVFNRALLERTLREAAQQGTVATDEATLVEGLGQEVAIVESTPLNLKITTPDDLTLAEGVLAQIGGAAETSP